jgi:chromosomal replication initiator protein
VCAEFSGNRDDVDEFLIGPENRLVECIIHAAADFARAPGERKPPEWLNPLAIVGAPGSGKSHLVRGLVSLLRSHPAARSNVIVTTAADFASRYAAAVGEDSLAQLRQRNRSARLWIVEDLGRLPDRKGVQAEFLHTLDELLSQAALVVVTAHAPPQQLTSLQPAIRSRFEAGLVLPLAPPSVDVRREFLRRASTEYGVPLEPHEVDELARRLPATPRQLLGALHQTRLGRTAGLANDSQGTVSTKSTVLPLKIGIDEILAVTARYFGLPQALLRSGSRKQSVVHARSVVMYLARELAGCTLQEIGAALGGRDHTTVLHACRKIDRSATEKTAIQEELCNLRRLLLAT